MGYRYIPKERKTTRFSKILAKKNTEATGYNAKNTLPRKKVIIAAVSVLLVLAAFFVTSSATGYFLYAESLRSRLSEAEAAVNASNEEIEACEATLFSCAEDLDVCKFNLTGMSAGFSRCITENQNCTGERNKYMGMYAELGKMFNATMNERDIYRSKWIDCNTNYTDMQVKYTALSNMKISYRNLVCCLSKIGQTGVTKMYWAVSGDKIDCKTAPASDYEEIDVAGLGC